MKNPEHSFSNYARVELNRFVTRLSLRITIFGCLLVLLCTLYPFRFSVPENFSLRIFREFFNPTTPLDVLVNVPLFMPLGFGIAGLLRKSKMSSIAQLLTILGLSAGLSLTVELLQLFLPSRAATLADVVTNGFGGMIGGLCFREWGEQAFSYALSFKSRGKGILAKLSLEQLAAVFLGYMLLAFAAAIALQITTLYNWNPSFPLSLGSDRIGTYPWKGTISDVQIANQAVSWKKAKQILSDKSLAEVTGNSIVTSYSLTGEDNYPDQTRNLPNLVWRGKHGDKPANQTGAILSGDRWLEISGSASPLIRALSSTSQFTLTATITPADIEQARKSMAPIVSISSGPGEYNFILGQRGAVFVFWLRTTLNMGDLETPDGIVGGLLKDLRPQHLIISYSGSVLRFYTDRSTNQYSFYLIRTMPRVVLQGLIFAPLAFLFSLIARKMKGGLIFKAVFLFAGVLLPPILLEGLLVSITNRNINWESLLLGLLIMVSALLVFQGTNIISSSKQHFSNSLSK